MECLHFADLHVGKKTHGKQNGETGLNTRVEDQRDRLLEIPAIASARGADVVLFAGDLFETTTPTPTQQRIAINAMREIAEVAPVAMIPGNHEHPASQGRRHALDVFYDIPGFYVFERPEQVLWHKGEGPLPRSDNGLGYEPGEVMSLAMLPWPLQRLADEGRSVKATYRSVAKEATATANRIGCPAVAMGHFTVGGSLPAGSEKSLQMGSEVVMPAEMFSEFDYTALGHIHKHQNVRDQTDPSASPVVYASSPERLSFNEEGQPKGVVALDSTQPEGYEFIQTSARDFITIEANVREEERPTNAIIQQVPDSGVEGAIVRVRYQAKEGQVVRTDKVREALSEAHTIDSIDRSVDRKRQERGAGLEASDSLEDQLREFARTRELEDIEDELVSSAGDIVDDISLQ